MLRHSYTPTLSDLVSSCSTQIDLSKLAENTDPLLGPIFTEESKKEIWTLWGRKQMGQRILNTACLVITNAMYGETTRFRDIQEMSKGATYRTMFHLLDHFSQLCLQERWPLYPALIVDQNGNMTSGFFNWYETNIQSFADAKERDDTVAEIKADCFKRAPSAVDITLAVTKYIYNNKL